ncbi:MAG: VIT domain-containing protein, partial [bacterium]
MKKLLCTFGFVFLFLNSVLLASNSLQVIKTSSGATGSGCIERCAYIIKPLGIYAQVSLDISYSAKNSYYYKDTTEIFHSFDLPNNAVVNDSWLWIGDSIIKAFLIDKWKAGLIYEGIVKRRKDPSILYKKTATSYEFRIYPTPPNSERRARITFLLPMTFSNGTSSITIPINMIKNISNTNFSAEIFVEENSEFGVPSLNSVSMDKLHRKTSWYGPGYLYQEPSNKLSNYTIEFSPESGKNYYFSNSPISENEGYYQFAFSPRKMVDLNLSRKVAILLDYNALNTSLSTNDFLELIKNSALKSLTEKDSFNVIISNINIKRAREKWVVAHPDSIYAVFESIKPDDLAKYSCLKNLIFNGISFVNSNNGGMILLASADDVSGSNVVANPFIEDIYKTFDNKVPTFHIADYSKNSYTYKINGVTYIGNQYLYQYLSKNTKGSYILITKEQDNAKFFSNAFEQTYGQIQAVNWRIETK